MKNSMFKLFIFLAFTFRAYAENIDNRLILEKLNGIENRLSTIENRLNNIDKRIDDTKQQLNQRIEDLRDSLNKRIDDSRTYDIAIVISILSLMALILWDRRTALKPIYDQIQELKERLEYIWKQFIFDNKSSPITT